MLQFHTISDELYRLLKYIQQQPGLGDLRLVGGTALALQYGHRESVDLDFFGSLDLEDIAIVLKPFESVQLIRNSTNIKIYLVNGIKVDFVNYPYAWIDQAVLEEGLVLASDKDIAAMKIAAITGRGSKKDFIDLYFLLKKYSLDEIIAFYIQKFPDATKLIALKSLVYFSDADAEPTPKMIHKVSWEEAKLTIIAATKDFLIQ
jgi:predicted nucleotidyltransferase component of viral defense system